ncbi:thioredoxin family protein [Prevotella sp.]|uniref:thioredoxin family protein n=1 Tax=Prevotella sp. TaxID=59823 RepID=UPI002F93367C
MKKIFFLLVCSLILGNIDAFAQPAGNGIKFFQGSFEQALAEAKKQNKPLFVDFYAVWCGPCKRMAKTVFTQDSVGSYFNDKFISLQLDAEKGDNVAIAKQYKVDAYPTLAFIDKDGKALSVNVGAMSAAQLLDAARIVAGESVGFEQLYNNYKKNPEDLQIQQDVLLQAPRFLAAQEGVNAEKWVVRIGKIFRNYFKAKKGPSLINTNDYLIVQNLGEDDEIKGEMANFINDNLDKWKQVMGNTPCYYVVEYNDQKAEKLAKEGNLAYKDYLEKIRGEYKSAYEVAALTSISPYDRASMYLDALYSIYKEKDVDKYMKLESSLLAKLADNVSPYDYGQAAQNLYYAAGGNLKPQHHQTAIKWVEKALKDETNVMDRINFIVMMGDSYRQLKDYAKAKELYNQAYVESLQMQKAEMAQAMLQQAISRKMAELDLLNK